MELALNQDKARIETRLSKVQKDFFEKAAAIAGFNTLTDFVLTAVKEKAESIIEKHETILASERDRKIFFEALDNPPKLNKNKALIAAAQKYKQAQGQ